MRNLRNKNAPPLAGLVQNFIDTAYDVVKAVYDNLDIILEVGAALEAGDLDSFLADTDIDTLAKLNAIVADATLGSIETLATAAQGALADTAIQGPFATQGEAEAGTDNTHAMTALRVAQAIAVQSSSRQDKYDATVDPTTTDDSDAGYSAGSVWINVTDSESFRCADPSVGAAVWIKTTLTADELATVALTGNSDDLTEGVTKLLMTTLERSRLAAMEDAATADQTGAEIKVAYEAEANTNAFTDTEQTKLGLIEDNATADQTNTEIATAYNTQTPVVSQVDAEAGTSTTAERWTPERVSQAIAALAVGGGGVTPENVDPINVTAFWDFNTAAVGQDLIDEVGGYKYKCNNGDNKLPGKIGNGEEVNPTGGKNYESAVGNTPTGEVVTRDIDDNPWSHTFWWEPLSITANAHIEGHWHEGGPVANLYWQVAINAAGNGFHFRVGNVAGIKVADTGDISLVADGTIYFVSITHNPVLDIITIAVNAATPSSTAIVGGNNATGDLTRGLGKPLIGGIHGHGVMSLCAYYDIALTTGQEAYIFNSDLGRLYTDYSQPYDGSSNTSKKLTGTTHTIDITDNGYELIFTNAAAIAVTLPDGLPEDFHCVITQTTAAGIPTVTPATDTINGAGTGVAPSAQWEGIHIGKFSATEWIAKGT